jgi:hypothetical protein
VRQILLLLPLDPVTSEHVFPEDQRIKVNYETEHMKAGKISDRAVDIAVPDVQTLAIPYRVGIDIQVCLRRLSCE